MAEAAPPPFHSQAGKFVELRPTLRAPSRPIHTAGGSLIDFPALAGKVIVVNFWATWCVPCAAEMPSLDRLAASLGGAAIVVMPIAVDAPGKPVVKAFYRRFHITHLKIYVDPDQQVGHFGATGPRLVMFPVFALPTTYLIDPHGDVLGYVVGAANWDSPAARRLLAWVAAN